MTLPNDDYDPMQQIKEISANLNQPDKFAEIFCTAAKSQKKIDEALKDIVKTLFRNDIETKNLLIGIVKSNNKEDVFFYLNKILFAFWSIILLFIGAYLNSLFK